MLHLTESGQLSLENIRHAERILVRLEKSPMSHSSSAAS
jgi:hypothetical protein